MPAPSTLAGDITAIFSGLGVIGGTIVTWKSLLPARRDVRSAKETAESTHRIVNQQRTDMLKYIADLVEGYPDNQAIPRDQSLKSKGADDGNG